MQGTDGGTGSGIIAAQDIDSQSSSRLINISLTRSSSLSFSHRLADSLIYSLNYTLAHLFNEQVLWSPNDSTTWHMTNSFIDLFIHENQSLIKLQVQTQCKSQLSYVN